MAALIAATGVSIGLAVQADREARVAEEARGETHGTTRECAQALIDLYAVREAAGPEGGYGAKGAAWRARLEALGAGP